MTTSSPTTSLQHNRDRAPPPDPPTSRCRWRNAPSTNRKCPSGSSRASSPPPPRRPPCTRRRVSRCKTNLSVTSLWGRLCGCRLEGARDCVDEVRVQEHRQAAATLLGPHLASARDPHLQGGRAHHLPHLHSRGSRHNSATSALLPPLQVRCACRCAPSTSSSCCCSPSECPRRRSVATCRT